MDRLGSSAAGHGVEASNEYFDGCFSGQRLMAIIRGLPPAETVQWCHRAWEAGIELVEVPLQDPEAVASLRAAAEAAQAGGRTIGVGTVTQVGQVEEARRVGASFTVAPGLDEEVARASLDAGLPHLPGVGTATEVQRVMGLGLRWMKAFPAAQLSPGWVKALLAPFPRACFVATGGVDAGNAAAFVQAGARAVAVGSALGAADQLAQLTALNILAPGAGRA